MRGAFAMALTVLLSACGWIASARAQEIPPAPSNPNDRPAFLLFGRSDGDRASRRVDAWRERLRSRLEAEGGTVVERPSAWAEELLGEGPSRARVDALREIETLLVSARKSAAVLDEGRALSALGRAERLAEDLADVPGASSWLAEVEIAIGITAMQAGREDLARAALARATLLDPGRGVRAAEAPPRVVELAAAIAREASLRPTGTFLVATDPSGARVFLDDELVGLSPVVVRAPAGLHVLRVEKPGHAPFGRVFPLAEGPSSELVVKLAPAPLLADVRAMASAGRAGDRAGVSSSLARIARRGVEAEAWVVEVGDGPRDRALLHVCSAAGCTAPIRLEAGRALSVAPRLPLAEDPRREQEARAWLVRAPLEPRPPREERRMTRWPLWVTAAAIGVSAIALGAYFLRPEPAPRLRTVIELPPDLSE